VFVILRPYRHLHAVPHCWPYRHTYILIVRHRPTFERERAVSAVQHRLYSKLLSGKLHSRPQTSSADLGTGTVTTSRACRFCSIDWNKQRPSPSNQSIMVRFRSVHHQLAWLLPFWNFKIAQKPLCRAFNPQRYKPKKNVTDNEFSVYMWSLR
jgi:hypothetical protein